MSLMTALFTDASSMESICVDMMSGMRDMKTLRVV